jgi:hypothetical protein
MYVSTDARTSHTERVHQRRLENMMRVPGFRTAPSSSGNLPRRNDTLCNLGFELPILFVDYVIYKHAKHTHDHGEQFETADLGGNRTSTVSVTSTSSRSLTSADRERRLIQR